MADQPLTKHNAADGSTYWLDVQSPGDEYGAQYRVQLVRGSLDVSGQEREQQLTLGAYNSWGEADEHRGELELELNQRGIEALGDAAQQVAARPYTDPLVEVAEDISQETTRAANVDDEIALSVTLDEHLTPVDPEGRYVPHHLDADGTAHWFSVVDSPSDADQPYHLRYFRAARDDDGGVIHDSYPVMPMADTEHSPWPIPELNFYLEEGDLEAAQDLSQRVAQAHHLPFPDPLDLPELTPEARYYFGYGLGEDGSPSLEAVKTWPEGSERRFSTFTIATYGTFDGASVDLQELESIQAAKGMEAAMNVAESMAVASGFLHDQRDDPRVFSDGPPDPFTTERERVLEEEMNSDQPQEAEYSVEAISANNQARLEAWKTWGEGEDQRERLLISQPDWETAKANAEAAHEMIQAGDLQNAMNLVELAAVEQGARDGNRQDPRLFTQGPPDLFTTIRQRELARERGELPDVTEMDTEPLVPVTVELAAPTYPAMYQQFAEDMARQREANASLPGAAWFEATFEDAGQELLHPLDETVNYGVVVRDADPWTLELAVEKYWKEPNGMPVTESQTLNTYDPDDGRSQAQADREALLNVHQQQGLAAMMHQTELTAVKNTWLSAGRPDPRLFRHGPPDRFQTLAQELQNEPNPFWNLEGEKIDNPAPAEADGVQNPYWRLDRLPVNNPEGQRLGYALYCVRYPGVDPANPKYDASTPFEMVEMAHFASLTNAYRFGREFHEFVVPGVVDGPELAEEVAKFEGLPGKWETLQGPQLQEYLEDNLTVTRDPADWYLHNPNAEREAEENFQYTLSDPLAHGDTRAREPGLQEALPSQAITDPEMHRHVNEGVDRTDRDAPMMDIDF